MIFSVLSLQEPPVRPGTGEQRSAPGVLPQHLRSSELKSWCTQEPAGHGFTLKLQAITSQTNQRRTLTFNIDHHIHTRTHTRAHTARQRNQWTDKFTLAVNQVIQVFVGFFVCFLFEFVWAWVDVHDWKTGGECWRFGSRKFLKIFQKRLRWGRTMWRGGEGALTRRCHREKRGGD